MSEDFARQLTQLLERANDETACIDAVTRAVADQTEHLRMLWGHIEHSEQMRAAFFARVLELWPQSAPALQGYGITPPLPHQNIYDETARVAAHLSGRLN